MTSCFFIPARGGSKGVPKKNLRNFAGHPLIYWTIKAALKSSLKFPIFVSSDDEDILDYSSQFQGVTCIKRGDEFSRDKSTMISVLQDFFSDSHILKTFNNIILLQPTAPFRTASDIQESFKLFCESGEARSVVSVCHHPDLHPARMYKIKSNCLISLDHKKSSINRQDLEPVYHRNGCIYITNSAIISSGSILCSRPIPYNMPSSRSLNIDTEFDFVLADVYQRHLLSLT
jgi:CMP-N,N'-diacetyllegionaminic acid synthase